MICYIRAIQADWPAVESLAIALGVAHRAEEGELIGNGWVFVGPVYQNGIPVTDENGNEYVHANLVYDGSLRVLAELKALQNPEIAAALLEIPRYFVTDENGNPVAPRNPARVIFGQG